jgi:hypothetical protein
MTRDIDRYQTSSGWHIALDKAAPPAGDNFYLGDPEVVHNLVRAFVGGICERFAACGMGSMYSQEAAALDEQECRRLGEIFAGRNEEFTSIGDWNGPGVVAFARKSMPELVPQEGDEAQTMTQVMAVLAHEVYALLQDLVDDRDEEGCKDALEGRILDWTNLLLGLPPANDEPEEPFTE